VAQPDRLLLCDLATTTRPKEFALDNPGAVRRHPTLAPSKLKVHLVVLLLLLVASTASGGGAGSDHNQSYFDR
jgi:hypothetical protein